MKFPKRGQLGYTMLEVIVVSIVGIILIVMLLLLK